MQYVHTERHISRNMETVNVQTVAAMTTTVTTTTIKTMATTATHKIAKWYAHLHGKLVAICRNDCFIVQPYLNKWFYLFWSDILQQFSWDVSWLKAYPILSHSIFCGGRFRFFFLLFSAWIWSMLCYLMLGLKMVGYFDGKLLTNIFNKNMSSWMNV